MTRCSRRSRRLGSAPTVESSASSASRSAARGKDATGPGREKPVQRGAGRGRGAEDLAHPPGAGARSGRRPGRPPRAAAGLLASGIRGPGSNAGWAAAPRPAGTSSQTRTAGGPPRLIAQAAAASATPLQGLVPPRRLAVDDLHIGRQAARRPGRTRPGSGSGGRQLEGSAVPQRAGALDQRLAEGALAHQLGAVGVAQVPATISLALALPRSTRTIERQVAGGGVPPAGRDRLGECSPSVTTTSEASGRNTPATPTGLVHEAARVSAHVEHAAT